MCCLKTQKEEYRKMKKEADLKMDVLLNWKEEEGGKEGRSGRWVKLTGIIMELIDNKQ